ncbi:hypothetical protein BamMEX5DRAFT_2325 [Burkholderia ambifaria MEX-5]|uniref:Uncharacterized protein n=1 Tax=Burkholderia ambifaria MEX-5 TaxID=396597 RepID=B1T3F9_9BURK|nr:hypothetical protein BamMEX5DRAFT_2325 [Burkholderia ambifaria MEX-5]
MQHVAIDRRQAARALPQLRGRERQHDERDDRMEQECGLERRVQRAGLLRGADAFGKTPDMLERNAADHPLAQQPAFVDDLAQPDRRQPGHAMRDVEEPVDEFGDERERIVFDLRRGRPPHERDDLREPFLDDRVEQLLAIREVVVDHRRRDAGGRGDLRDRRCGDAVLGEQLDRHVEHVIAQVEVLHRRAAPARPGDGGFRVHADDAN